MRNRLSILTLLALLFAFPAYATDVCSSGWSETDASNNTASPAGFPEGMAPSGVNDAARAVMGATKRFWNRNNGVKTSGGTNTATLAYDVAAAAYCTGERFLFIVGGTNTGATTLNVNTLGAKNIYRNDGATSALIGGELVAGQYAEVVYDGTQFRLITAPTALGPLLLYNSAVTTQTAISVAIPTTVRNVKIEGRGCILSGDGEILLLRVSIAAAVKSDGTYYNNQNLWGNDGGSVVSTETSTAHLMSREVDNAGFSGIASWGFNFDATVKNLQSTTLFKTIETVADYINNAGPVYEAMHNLGRYTGAAGAIDAIQFAVATGTFSCASLRAQGDRN